MSTPISWMPDELFQAVIGLGRDAWLDSDPEISVKPDESLVTSRDTAIELAIRDLIRKQFPDDEFVGEETISKETRQRRQELARAMLRGSKRRVWVLDPIDGTALFAAGMSGWGVSLGLVDDGIAANGTVMYPSLFDERGVLPDSHLGGTLFGTDEEQLFSYKGRWEGERALGVSRHNVVPRPVISGYKGMLILSQAIAKHKRYVGREQIICLASCVQSFKALVTGAADAYIAKVKIWDIAAVWPMARVMGIDAICKDGSKFDYEFGDKNWIIDPDDPGFLGMKEHVVFCRKGYDAASIWKSIID